MPFAECIGVVTIARCDVALAFPPIECMLECVLLIPLWRPAARRARSLATPLASREQLSRGAYP